MNPESEDPGDSAACPTRRRRGVATRIVLWVIVPYVSIVVMITFLQRKLIYLPTRETVSAAETGYTTEQLQQVSVDVDDELALKGWLVLADGQRAERDGAVRIVGSSDQRLILYFPGNAGHRGYRIREIRQFSGLGNHVLFFDYRGYGENGGSPTEQNLIGDARRIWDYATSELGVRPEQIILWGESLGGGVATQLAASLCDEGVVPGGLMLRGTFTALTDTAACHYPWLPVRWLLVDRYESIERIPNVTCPLLVIHGRQDRIVPFEQGERLFAAAPDESHDGRPKMFVELPDAGHNDIMYVAADDVEAAVAKFLENLP